MLWLIQMLMQGTACSDTVSPSEDAISDTVRAAVKVVADTVDFGFRGGFACWKTLAVSSAERSRDGRGLYSFNEPI